MPKYRPICESNLSRSPLINRRGFCALPVAAMVFSTLAKAGQVAANDPRIHTERIAISADWGKLDCYLARPSNGPNAGAGVVVAHDRLGPTPHFEDVARRLALEGFVALLPDYASRFGGTPIESGPALEVVGMTKLPDMIADTHTALLWLQSEGKTTQTVAVGFGRGGTTINNAITKLSELRAAATFYGHPPPSADVASISVPLLLNFAGNDQFVGPEIPAFVDALKKAGVKYELFIYDNTVPGFEDDSVSARYSEEAAKLAWSRTNEFLKAAIE